MATYSALPATLNLVATVGNDFTLSLTVTENGSSWVSTGATLATDIIDSSGTVVATDFTTAASTGTVSLSLTDTQTTTLGVGVYSYRLSVTKSSLTRDWIAGTLSIVEAGVGGSSTSSASLSISNSAVTLGITSLVAPNPTILPISNGTDDTAAIQAVLTAYAGKVVKGRPGESYIISAPLVISSNTTLDMTGCTVTLAAGSDCSMLRNEAVTPLRTVADAAITSGGVTLTSATAAFTSADVGRSVTLTAAGAGLNSLLVTTISAVTNSTTATVALAATNTATNATLNVYERDHDITVVGGSWERGANAGSGTNLFNLMFRHIDRLTVRDAGGSSSAAGGKGFVNVADATHFLVENITLPSWAGDAVHVTGPASFGQILNIQSNTADDGVAFTCADWPSVFDMAGDITDMVVDGILGTITSSGSLLKLSGGTAFKTRRVTCRNISGTSVTWGVAITDDNQNGVNDCDDITIDGVHVGVVGGAPIVSIQASAAKTIKIANVQEQSLPAGQSGNIVQVSQAASSPAASVDRLILENLNVTLGTSRIVVNVAANATIGDLVIQGGRFTLATGNGNVISTAASTSTVSRIICDDLYLNTCRSLLATAASTPAITLVASNIYAKSCSRLLVLAGTSVDATFTACVFDSIVAAWAIVTTGTLTVRGSGVSRVGTQVGIQRSGSEVVRVINPDWPCDVGLLAQSSGDTCYNTAAATGVLPGVGRVISDGTTWRLATIGAVKTGTATLVGGTVTVNDSAITANSVIRLAYKTIGGTPGAVYVSARTASTSFAITSTSGTDTSVIQYDIITY